jgi:hypothetical protein
MKLIRAVTVQLAIAALLVGCGRESAQVVGRVDFKEPPPPDVGDVSHFLNCSARPRRELSPRERCEIGAFKSRCSINDDCYVSCISSPDGVLIGGACEHACGLGAQAGTAAPAALAACQSLPGASGLKPRLGPNNSFKPKPLRGSA